MNSKPIKQKKRIYLSPPHMGEDELRFVTEAFDSGYVAPVGEQLDRFEKEFCEKTGFPHAVAVSSGTAAMHLAMAVLGVGPGDEVAASTLTFVGSVNPIVYQGAAPVFIDSDGTWNMDPNLLEDELEKCAKKGRLPKAVVPTDLYGQPCDLDAITGVCSKYGIPVVSDSAESLGAMHKERPAGFGADAAVFSFNGNKIITTSAGGMIASENRDFVEEARFLSQQARDPFPHYEHSKTGYNYRMSNILAAIGRGQLGILDDRVEKKRRIFEYYNDALAGLPGIEFMPESPHGKSSRWLTAILIDCEVFGASPEDVRLALEAENIESRPVWKPMHLQPVFNSGNPKARAVGGSVSEDLFRRGLCLPSGTALETEDLDRIAGIVTNLGKKRRGE